MNYLAHCSLFDLMKYGKPMCAFIIDQLKQEDKPAYWKVLGKLFNAMPYKLALEVINSSMNGFLQYVEPNTLRQLCLEVVCGTAFEPIAALGMAEVFDDLAEIDKIQMETWKEISDEFERLATEQVEKIECNHLFFILLTMPNSINNYKSLIEIALEQRRLIFLNSERIANVMEAPITESIFATG